MKARSNSYLKNHKTGQSGQIIFEYVLMLVVSVGIAAMVTRMMVSRNADSPGFLISKWQQMLVTIGSDLPDGQNPQ